jgi:hypothetical protein
VVVTLDLVIGANHDVVLAEIRSWTQTANELETSADDYVQMMERPGGTVWSGRTAEAAVTLAHGDRRVIVTDADGIAGMSTNGEDAMVAPVAALSDVRAMIENARRLGFDVNQDLSVSWTRPAGMSDSQAEAYENAVGPFSQQIQAAGKAWWDSELAAAETMTSEANGLTLPFDESGNPSTVEHRDGRIVLVNGEEPPPLIQTQCYSRSRQAAVDYAEDWANGSNPAYGSIGGGDLDCTNFASQVMRAGGFSDVGDGLDDWHRGDANDWYFHNGPPYVPGNKSSNSWALAKESHNFVTQNSGRGEIKGIAQTGGAGLDPLAPSRAGLIPGDLIYYKDAGGQINHTAVYVGQAMVDGRLTDVIDQHSAGVTKHDDWMPNSAEYTRAPAQAEFVHLTYPGE